MKQQVFKIGGTSLLLAGLAACGGGGGSSPATTSPTTPFPLANAMSALAQSTTNFSVSAASGADTYTLQVSLAPGVATTFEGQSAAVQAQSATIKKNGTVVNTLSGNNYLNVSPYKQLGAVDLGNGRYTVNANQQNLPTSATVGLGSSGQLDTAITYTDSTKSAVYSNTTETWSLAADAPTTAWACINATETVVGSTPTVSSSCYKIDTTGNVLGYKATLYFNGTLLSFN